MKEQQVTQHLDVGDAPREVLKQFLQEVSGPSVELNDEQLLYHAAISLWGEDAQTWMLVEEIGEVLQGLSKVRRNTLA